MSYRVLFERATADYRLGREGGDLLLHGPKKTTAVKCPKGDGYRAELAYFVDCIRANRPPETVTAAQVAQSIRIIEAEEKSALTGRIVKVAGG
jgi:predicted dehydrogenase